MPISSENDIVLDYKNADHGENSMTSKLLLHCVLYLQIYV